VNTQTIPIIQDRFSHPEYIDPQAQLPLIQSLRGETPGQCGYFVSLSEIAKSNWIGEMPTIDSYTFFSGDTEEGVLLRQPRMLVLPKSKVMAYDRVKFNQNQTLELLGNYRDFKSQPNVSNVQLFEILLLDKNNNPLHELPFRYAAKGSNQATFAVHYQLLISEVTLCHAKANGIPARAKNAEFNALCVFEFEVIRELAGDSQKSFACKVGSHSIPTMNDWQNFFLGCDDSVANRMLQLLSVPVSDRVIAAAKPVVAEVLDRAIDSYEGDVDIDIDSIPF
jgi:Family of unknown function (DUF5895)